MKYTSPIGKFSAAALLAAFVLTFSTAVKVQAQPVPIPPQGGAPTPYNLGNLNNNPNLTFTNGNLVFSSFDCAEVTNSLNFGLATTTIDTYNLNGIAFQNGSWTVNCGTNYDLNINFIVSSLNGSPFTDIGAVLDAFNYSNTGRVSLTEEVSTVGPGGGAGNSIALLALSAAGITSTNILLAPDYSSLYIHKDFNMNDLTATNGYLFGSDIIQTYITTTPEPSTYAMLVSGLAGLGFMIRRRK